MREAEERMRWMVRAVRGERESAICLSYWPASQDAISTATASTLSSLVVLEPTAGQGARVAQDLAVSEAPPGGVVGIALKVVGVDAEAGVGHIHGCYDDGDEEEGEGEFSHGEYYEDNGSCAEMFLRGKLE